MMVLRSSAWSLPWEKVILMMLLTPCGVDFVNTLLYHLEALQLSFFSFFLSSPTLSEGYNTNHPLDEERSTTMQQEYPILEFDKAPEAILEPNRLISPIDIPEHAFT